MPIRAKFCVVVVDVLEMRRAGIAALLTPWAAPFNASVVSLSPEKLTFGLQHGVRPIFVIFSVGGISLKSKQAADWGEQVRLAFPGVPSLALSDRQEPEEAIAAARMGLNAFINSSIDPQVALHAFALVINGGTYFPRDALLKAWEPDHPVAVERSESGGLTPRQSEVLQRLLLGSSNKHIARDLSMQESTVKVHVREIMRKLGARNRTEAVLLAGRSGIFRPTASAAGEEWRAPTIAQASAM
ncbi:DNA-binding response regulator, NarL/FixJ family, contains REC and HTH domains [Devosia crocina]|uniref:DNA-binding response regulator, NarL/FixJ family, contains REC and HTH domains n=1 Tax=Devosia crocina TaxID=429728 RepID=A0A1I7MZ42_9HYPH|nr:response regulator transcription factor [Devosia crocina]SFV27672.1 DNA-binding response regulator, NarL/FixJ family, contains REC and HTH domains [Devosia crocina]